MFADDTCCLDSDADLKNLILYQELMLRSTKLLFGSGPIRWARTPAKLQTLFFGQRIQE
jgi:hypothetical protein